MRSLVQKSISPILRIKGNILDRVKLIQKLESLYAHLRLSNQLHGSNRTESP